MSESELISIAKYLAEQISCRITSSPGEPDLIIKALRLLIPDAEEFWSHVETLSDEEEQWSQIIGFIESEILDEQEFGFEKLETEELIEVYKVIIQLVHDVKESGEQIGAQSDEQGSESGETVEGSDDNEDVRRIPPPQEDYLTQVKREQQLKKSQRKNQIHSQRQQQQNLKKKEASSHKPQQTGKQTQKKVQKKSTVKQSSVKKQTQRPKTAKPKKPHSIMEEKPLKEQILGTIAMVDAQKESRKKKATERENHLKDKTNTLMRDQAGSEMMAKAKRQFNYEIKEHSQQLRKKKEANKRASSAGKKRDSQYARYLQQKGRQLEEQVLGEQIKYYHQLREKKMGYIKHMHKLIEKLERERNLDLKKKQRQAHDNEKRAIGRKIEHADHVFRQNMDQIRVEYREQRAQSTIKNSDEIDIMQQMEKKIQKDQQSETQVMKRLWEQERMKLQLISRDEENMKRKLESMYRKAAPKK